MCLLKVYLDEGSLGRRLVAQEIALVAKDKDTIRLRNLEFEDRTIDNVEIVLIDTLNSVLLLKRKGDKT
ncbi:hypothetical protein CP083_00400 [Candidatus Bathyarchaeota archaeon B24-2]|nr:MAG: hypothetical protein CP083_00400 [Candidatus Bathyarchaeota archaeon B24-2]